VVSAGSLVITDVLVAWEAEVVDHLPVAVMVVVATAVTAHPVVWYIAAIAEVQDTTVEDAVDLVAADM
jgi:hypothetical protein